METKFNFNSQVCTSRSQSERFLALGLKKETADTYISNGVMCARPYSEVIEFMRGIPIPKEIIPAWSLHRLLCMLPRCVEGGYHLAISYDHIEYRTTYNEVTTWWRGGGNIYDMIIETIKWLIKEGYFNKEYLV